MHLVAIERISYYVKQTKSIGIFNIVMFILIVRLYCFRIRYLNRDKDDIVGNWSHVLERLQPKMPCPNATPKQIQSNSFLKFPRVYISKLLQMICSKSPPSDDGMRDNLANEINPVQFLCCDIYFKDMISQWLQLS